MGHKQKQQKEKKKPQEVKLKGSATIQAKTRLVNEHNDLLEVIWKFGKGLLYRKHINEYMRILHGKDKIAVAKALQELRYNKMVEFIYYNKAVIVKMLKFTITHVTGNDKPQSISVSDIKIKRTAYINEIILSGAEKKKTPEEARNYIVYSYDWSTYFKKDRAYYEALYAYRDKDFCDNRCLWEEIKQLKQSEKNSKIGSLKDKEEFKKVKERFNLNSICSSNMHIANLKNRKGKHTINIAILDISHVLKTKHLLDKINSTLDYFYTFLHTDKVRINFIIAVGSYDRKKFYNSTLPELNVLLVKKYGSEYAPTVKAQEYDIYKKLFNSQETV